MCYFSFGGKGETNILQTFILQIRKLEFSETKQSCDMSPNFTAKPMFPGHRTASWEPFIQYQLSE